MKTKTSDKTLEKPIAGLSLYDLTVTSQALYYRLRELRVSHDSALETVIRHVFEAITKPEGDGPT